MFLCYVSSSDRHQQVDICLYMSLLLIGCAPAGAPIWL